MFVKSRTRAGERGDAYLLVAVLLLRGRLLVAVAGLLLMVGLLGSMAAGVGRLLRTTEREERMLAGADEESRRCGR